MTHLWERSSSNARSTRWRTRLLWLLSRGIIGWLSRSLRSLSSFCNFLQTNTFSTHDPTHAIHSINLKKKPVAFNTASSTRPVTSRHHKIGYGSPAEKPRVKLFLPSLPPPPPPPAFYIQEVKSKKIYLTKILKNPKCDDVLQRVDLNPRLF